MVIISMSDIYLKIPSNITNTIRLPPDTMQEELLKELAIALYQRGILSSGQSCKLAGMVRYQWEDELARRNIPMHYQQEQLEEDLSYVFHSE